jgi:hypothetical protein
LALTNNAKRGSGAYIFLQSNRRLIGPNVRLQSAFGGMMHQVICAYDLRVDRIVVMNFS